MFPQIITVFDSTVDEIMNQYGMSNFINLHLPLSYVEPDLNILTDVCKTNQIDAVLLTKLKFINVTYSVYFIPVAENYDTEVEMKLMDKTGKLLYNTSHNTFKGNSYFLPPTPDETIHDGIEGALERMLKEMGLQEK